MEQKSNISRYLSVLAIILLTALVFGMAGGQANRNQGSVPDSLTGVSEETEAPAADSTLEAGEREFHNSPEAAVEEEIEPNQGSVPNVCQTDYTKITYSDGFYYYQSAADRYYLYRSDESGESRECLAKQVPQEIYVMGDWVYFTNLSQGSQLFKIRTDGRGMELVCGERIKRFLPMEGKFYCLAETENGGRIFSCTGEGETKNLFEGKCSWLCTDGELLYFETDNPEWSDRTDLAENAQGEAESQTVAMDGEGKIKEKYNIVLKGLLPTEKYLYYRETTKSGKKYVKEIIRQDRQTGSLKRYRLPDISISWWKDFSYAVCHGKVYVFMHDRYTPAYHIFQYMEETEGFEEICPQGKIEGRSTLYSKAEGIHLVNGKIFFKSYEGEGFGQLWHMLDISSGEETLFEGMEEPVVVATTGSNWGSLPRSREGYVEQDIEYSGEREDGQGCFMRTNLTLPRISGEVPAADVINGKIRRDAEQFYKEQLAFHETEEVREEMTYAGGDTSGGFLACQLAYADERYVSIVYEKELHVYGMIRRDYVTRLYSSETGEELQPRDLFGVDWEEVSLHLSFFIRRTELGFESFDSDLFSLDEKDDKVFYCLTGNGLEVFYVETFMRFDEDHFIIPYEELEDIWAHEEDVIYFSLLDGTTLQIDQDRFKDSYYGVNRLDNRWELDEIDIIMNSIKGRWKADEYMGFVAPTIYFPDLWDHNDNIGDDRRNSLYALYEEKTENAAANIPEISLLINEKYDGKALEQNYIYSQSEYIYASPVSIILSLDRFDANYPAFVDATVLTADFIPEHPVMYIKFFLGMGKDEYEPATLVITSDKRFYILIDGAFYSLVRSE